VKRLVLHELRPPLQGGSTGKAKGSTEAVAQYCFQAFAVTSKPNSLLVAAIIRRVFQGIEHESSLGRGADAAAADLAA
jgi:hypothetical protein